MKLIIWTTSFLMAFVDAITPIFVRIMSVYAMAGFCICLVTNRYYSHSKVYILPLIWVGSAIMLRQVIHHLDRKLRAKRS